MIPFFSRRIGLGANGTPQKIDFGTKMTGQLGRHDVGILHVRTGDDEDASMIGEDFTVARVKRRLLRQSYVGGLFTRRDARGDGLDEKNTLGVDFRLATSTFLGSQNLALTGWGLHASRARPDASGRTSAYGLAWSTRTTCGTPALAHARSSPASNRPSASSTAPPIASTRRR